jgi:hypothetical protein
MRQKKAYLRLYEKVGDEIGRSLHKSVQEKEKEIYARSQEQKGLSATELEMARLGERREPGEQTTLNDLFRKYNV